MSNLSQGDKVQIKEPHNHFTVTDDVYHVATINRTHGAYNVNLLLNGRSVGVVPENKLTIVK